jgi:Uma2 family endonuclease
VEVTDMIAPAATLTPEDLLALPDGDLFELVDGQLVERNMGIKSSWVGGRLITRLELFLEANGLGWVFPADSGYRCFPGRPNMVRKPDVSVVRRDRVPDALLPDGDFKIPPDLAVEVVSPNDLYAEVEKKVEEYLQVGVRLIWVIDPENRKVRIHRADRTLTDVRADGELNGEDVVPGFHCRIAELLPPVPPTPSP